ncbi:MAG: response regulator [Bacteroidota bacterium]
MLFGGQEGLTLFEPGKVSVNKLVPNIVLTDFRIKNKSVNNNFADSPLNKHINYTSNITLNHDESFFSIFFSALNYSHTENNQYAYRLEGLENRWNYAGNERSASYANVPPGNYKFKVIASNNNGIWNNTGREINIEILPPWWKTNWAYSAYVLIILLSIYLITKIISLRERMKSEFQLKELEFKQQQELLEKEHEIDQMKLQFLTNIAHEFRTPLTLVLSPISDILTSMKISPEVSGHLELAKKNAQRLLRLINQILDFSRIEGGFMKLEVKYGDFSSAVENICQAFMFRADKANITYTWDISHQKAFGYFDYDKIEKILYNIISNAFKFTDENGRIKIDVQYDFVSDTIGDKYSGFLVKKAYISIIDSGRGIPEDHLEWVFSRFSQAHGQGSGTGIGLSLAKSLANIHGGEIDVFSQVNQGTMFRVLIPLSREAFSEDSIQEDDWVCNISHHYGEVDPIFQIQTEKVDISLNNDAPVMLIVEDEEDMRHYIKSIFQKSFIVYTANNGLQGFDLSKKIMPDIVICDIMMPVMNGIEFTKQLKETKETSHVFVILLTAKTSKEDKLEGYETGAEDYIYKPFESDELRLKVSNIIETRRKFQEQFSLDPLRNLNKVGFNSMDKKIMEQIIGLINENLNNADLDHKFLCDQLGLSRSKLYRKVRALTNQSVHDFIRNVRLSKALELILDGWLSVSEVMYKVGFNNQSYFAKCFKEKYGKSPNEYIRK